MPFELNDGCFTKAGIRESEGGKPKATACDKSVNCASAYVIFL